MRNLNVIVFWKLSNFQNFPLEVLGILSEFYYGVQWISFKVFVHHTIIQKNLLKKWFICAKDTCCDTKHSLLMLFIA